MLLSLSDRRDARNFRPLSVDLSLAIHHINGHLVLDVGAGSGNVPMPIGFCDRLMLELDKTYEETRLQLVINPVNVFILDCVERRFDRNLRQGALSLSALQVRGHAMFSDEGRIKTDTLEYAWLLEILLGEVRANLTPVQAEQLVHGLESLFLLMFEDDHQLKPVYSDRIDPGLPYKYEITRFSIDCIELRLIESGVALCLYLYPVRLCMCDLHTIDYAKALTASING
jgi:hypothetical protein